MASVRPASVGTPRPSAAAASSAAATVSALAAAVDSPLGELHPAVIAHADTLDLDLIPDGDDV